MVGFSRVQIDQVIKWKGRRDNKKDAEKTKSASNLLKESLKLDLVD